MSGLELDTTAGPAWKPLPVLTTTVLAPLGDAAPALWLLLARAGGLLALVLAFRLAARLAGGAGRWFAGAVAALGLLATTGFLRGVAGGSSEGILIALLLLALDRHLDGRRGQAFGLGVAASLLRPEVWPFLAVYAVWLWRRDPGSRMPVAAGLTFVPVLWLAPELWGSGDLLRSSERALVPNPGQPALADHPALEVVKGFATMIPPPVLLLALGMTALAVVQRERILLAARRRLPQPGSPSSPRWPRPGSPGRTATSWPPPRASPCSAASAPGRVYEAAAARAPRVAAPAAALLLVAAVAAAIPAARRVGSELAYAAELRSDLAAAVERAGGPDRLRSCGPLYAGRYRFPLVAWHLRAHISELDLAPRAPGVVFSSKLAARRAEQPGRAGRLRARGPRRDLGGVRRVRRLAVPGPAASAAALLGLLALSAFLRTRALDASLWIDEGISAGIASYPAGEIPGLLRQDGSPPAYYLLLHAWTDLAGTSEVALRAPSVVFALLTVPAALWAGRSLFGREAGWICAAIAAVLPFLTLYAQEARMYALVGLLSVLATTAFTHAFAFGRRRHVPVLAALLALLLYTHYWALFLALGMLAALAALIVSAAREDRRRLLVDGALAFGLAGLAFAPWLPTLAFQLEHTGAPWSNPPPPGALAAALALAAAAAVVPRLAAGPAEGRALQALAVAAGVTLAAGWAAALVEPGWASRYLAVLVGPLLLLGGAALARIGPLGLVAAAAIACAWALDMGPTEKSNVAGASEAVAASLQPGDLVVSTQPEQVPVLAHYLPDGLRYATPLGPVADPAVMDWRNALPRLETTAPERALAPLLDELPPGARILLVAPEVGDGEPLARALDAPRRHPLRRMGLGPRRGRALPAGGRGRPRGADLADERPPGSLCEDRGDPWLGTGRPP